MSGSIIVGDKTLANLYNVDKDSPTIFPISVLYLKFIRSVLTILHYFVQYLLIRFGT